MESFVIRHAVDPGHPDYERKPLQGPNRWPDDPWFVDVVRRYDTATRELGLALLPAFSVAVGEAPDFFTRRFDPPTTALRLIHYPPTPVLPDDRSEEHTSELQSLMRISYAVFCLKNKKNKLTTTKT